MLVEGLAPGQRLVVRGGDAIRRATLAVERRAGRTRPLAMAPTTLLDRLIRFSLDHRVLVLASAALLLVLGAFWIVTVPVDIFPDLSAPSVTVVTDAPGMAPEEVEALVTFPIESAVNGATGIRRLRSVSADGLSVLWVEFEWGTEIYRARQVVTERLQRVELPVHVERPELGPISSIMGEITFIALTSDRVSPMDLRRIAETMVRRNLLAIPGVSQVVPIGGEVQELQITVRPESLAQYGIALDEVVTAAALSSRSPAAGFHVEGGQEYLVRGLGRARQPEEVAAAVVRTHDGAPIRIGDLANVAWGPEPQRGTASYRAKSAVILSVQKQPGANTLRLTQQIDRALERLSAALPEGVTIEKENFRQADFISIAIRNVTAALRDGAILVVVILFLFLGSWRTTLISALAIPLSLLAGVLVVSLAGGTINTMTLGGLTIAIGALVDDAIIDVENVFRRLRLESAKPEGQRRPPIEVVWAASSEVRKAIVFATLIIVLVFLPLLVLPGIEGRLLRPLGIAYAAAIAASLLVSLTVTPVLCYLLLPRAAAVREREPWLLRQLHRVYGPSLEASLRHRALVLGSTAVLVAAAAITVPTLGRSFLPAFNEGSLTVGVVSTPGIPLADSDALGRRVEEALLAFPEVISTSRRTGRAEKDEHVQGVNASEMEVVLGPLDQGRDKQALLAEMRRAVATIPGVAVSFGQPISHRIDHMISGSKTNLAVKVFGPDLAVLRGLAGSVESTLAVGTRNRRSLEPGTGRDSTARHRLRPADHGAARSLSGGGGAVGRGAVPGRRGRTGRRSGDQLQSRRALRREAARGARAAFRAAGHDAGRDDHPAARGGRPPLRPRPVDGAPRGRAARGHDHRERRRRGPRRHRGARARGGRPDGSTCRPDTW